MQGQDRSGQQDEDTLGSIGGTIVDQNGNLIIFSAQVTLVRKGSIDQQKVVPDSQGHFRFTGIPPGPFQLTVTANGFASQTRTGVLRPGEVFEMPDIALLVALNSTDVQVNVSQYDLAEDQVKAEEKQRVLGVIPNFYVTYDPNPLPLRPKQKFELAWKTSVDPVSFLGSGVIAGAEQAENTFSGYGQGAQGYAKRYGSSYANGFIGTMIGGAILPSLFKQDPRYFYKGTGSIRSRILYALANAVICKGDNGHWQANYSGILGSLAAGGISNLYYPAANRDGVELTVENTLIGIGASAAANLFQEFLVRKLTPHAQASPTVRP